MKFLARPQIKLVAVQLATNATRSVANRPAARFRALSRLRAPAQLGNPPKLRAFAQLGDFARLGALS